MRRIAVLLLVAAMLATAAKTPPAGKASDESAEVAAVFLDMPEYKNTYTVIEVTVTPKGGKPLDLQPDDFLLRVNSNSDSSGPVTASQVYGAGGGLVLHGTKETIGTTPANGGYSGATVVQGSTSASSDQIKALQDKMLPAKTTSSPTTGLLFFPIAKKGHRDLDLVYTSPTSKIHVNFR
jgi:hypothetical protein